MICKQSHTSYIYAATQPPQSTWTKWSFDRVTYSCTHTYTHTSHAMSRRIRRSIPPHHVTVPPSQPDEIRPRTNRAAGEITTPRGVGVDLVGLTDMYNQPKKKKKTIPQFFRGGIWTKNCNLIPPGGGDMSRQVLCSMVGPDVPGYCTTVRSRGLP